MHRYYIHMDRKLYPVAMVAFDFRGKYKDS